MPRHQECPDCLYIHPSTPPEFQEWEKEFHAAFCQGAKLEIFHGDFASCTRDQVAAMAAGYVEGHKLARG